jgi:hypothetical protein
MDCQADADAAAGDVRLAEAQVCERTCMLPQSLPYYCKGLPDMQRAATLGAYERAKRELKRKLDSLNGEMYWLSRNTG